jgi:peptidylprolyl isomerase
MHKNVIAPLMTIGILAVIGLILWAQFKISASDPEAKQQAALLQSFQSYGTSTATSNASSAQQNNNSTNPTNQTSMNATFHTNKGDFSIEFNSETPNTVANFEKLASSGFYNGVKFHRVIKGFMIQGGDPLTKDDAQKAKWGTGGPGYTFPDEITPDNKNDIGTIAMANAGPDTNGSQFFINVANNNFLDTKHTVFGKVTSGMDVVQAIEATKTNSADQPLEPVIINSITLQ